jgi:hypothetical protein
MNLRAIVGWSVLVSLSFISVRTADAQSVSEREIERLANQLQDGSHFEQEDAIERLLEIDPQDVSLERRKEIARTLKELAFDTGPPDGAINGLALWGGRYSVPILIELLESAHVRPPDEFWDAIARYPASESAEAVAKRLGNPFCHEQAVRCLRKMGSVAEPALIMAAPSRDAEVTIAALQLLGDFGTEKSVPVLKKASSSRNPDVRDLAKAALERIRDRTENGAAPAAGPSPDSTKAETAGTDAPCAGSSSGSNGWGNVVDNVEADRGDWSDVKLLLPGEPGGSVTPDAANTAVPDWKAKPIRLKAQSDFGPDVLSIGGDRNSPLGAVIYDSIPRHGISRVELVDFKLAKSVANFVAPQGTNACAISPSGKRMICTAAADSHPAAEWRMHLYDISNSRPLEKASWSPYATNKSEWGNSRINCVEWIDDNRAIAVNGSGNAVLWDLSGAMPKAIYQIDGRGGTHLVLSPGRSYFALSTPRGVEVFRSTDGTLLNRMEAPSVPFSGSMAFDSEGKSLTLVARKRIYHWDVVSGHLLSDFYCEALASSERIHSWVGDNLLLVDRDLVDLKLMRVLWRYEVVAFGNSKASCNASPYIWVAMESASARGLMPFHLPHAEAMTARDDLSDPALFVVKPGSSVTVENQIGDDNRDAIEEGLQRAIEHCGLKSLPDQPVRLIVRLGEVQKEDTTYRPLGGSVFAEGEKVTVETRRTYEVSLEVDGKPAWKSQAMQWTGSAPSLIQSKDGESAQQTVDREREEQKRRFQFSIRLPQYVVHPDKAGPVGTSKLTLTGIK